jgi:hypothetical protein
MAVEKYSIMFRVQAMDTSGLAALRGATSEMISGPAALSSGDTEGKLVFWNGNPVDLPEKVGVAIVPLDAAPPDSWESVVWVKNPRLSMAKILRLLGWGDTRPPLWGGSTADPGFGYVRDEAGKLVPFPQCGGLQLGTDVVVGRYTCIDRGALSDTIIGDAQIGDHTSIAALTCIEGSVKIGAYCTIGSNVTFQIGSGCGDHVTVGSGSVVTKYIPEGETWVGSPARKLR